MSYDTLAVDYDGTIATDGGVADATMRALERARAGGVRLVMVTGRELSDLCTVFQHVEAFDRVVAENGAVLLDPASQTMVPLADPAPRTFIDRLTEQHVPISVGHTIVATNDSYEPQVLQAIRELRLDWHVILNKSSLMALPHHVSKATGLTRALDALGLTYARTVGVGDAENDEAFLRQCGLSVAVANALPMLKQQAQVVTSQPNGAGVIEVVNRLLAGELDAVFPHKG